jgi:hypothetical protein
MAFIESEHPIRPLESSEKVKATRAVVLPKCCPPTSEAEFAGRSRDSIIRVKSTPTDLSVFKFGNMRGHGPMLAKAEEISQDIRYREDILWI